MVYRHIAGVHVTADFSGDRKYRYRLEVRKAATGTAGRTVCVIMQNPSYADGEVADRSVQFMEKIVFLRGLPEFAGVGRLIVVNLFAYIQTHGFVPSREKIGPCNDQAIEAAIREADIVVLAWGSAKSLSWRESEVRSLLKICPGKILLKTKAHPSRGRYTGFIAEIR